MVHELSENDPARSVEPGDTVVGIQYLTSCCLILVRTTAGIGAQHWPGMDPDNLDGSLFPDEEENEEEDRPEVTELFLVTALESPGQVAEATALRQRYPGAAFTYYAYERDLCPRPTVRVGAERCGLERAEHYHLVNIP